MPVTRTVVPGVWVLPVLVDEAVSAYGPVRACVLGAGVYDCGEFWGVYDAGNADGSAAWASFVMGLELRSAYYFFPFFGALA